MKEQSHKEEMSAAIRGDFSRLRERGVAATLAPREPVRPEPVPVEALPEPVARELEPALEPALEPPLEPGQAVDVPPGRPGLLARLLGRQTAQR